MNSTEAYIQRTDVENGIAVLEFFHPKSNSLPSLMLQQLTAKIRACSEDQEVEVIVLKSAGEGVFCAGASFHELMAIQDVKAGEMFFSGFADVINACRKCSKLIIARVQGKAIGGGVGLAAAADFCLATSSAEIRLSELSIGIGPFVIEPALSRKIGVSALSNLTLDCVRTKSAHWACEKGLYHEVLEDVVSLDVRVMELAKTLAGTNPAARSELKKVFWQGCENWDQLLAERAAMSGQLVLSTFTKEALKKFR